MTGGVWIDARAAQDPEQGLRGIGRYVLEHSHGLVAGHSDRVTGVVVDGSEGLPERLAWLTDSPLLRPFEAASVTDPPAVYHVMSAFEPLWPRTQLLPAWLDRRRTRLVVTVYDLIPKVLDAYRLTGWRRARYEARLGLLRTADQLLCISEVTARDVERVLGVPRRRLTVIDAGATQKLDTGVTMAAATQMLAARFPGLGRGFPLYVGGADPRKNLELLVEAWAQVPVWIRAGRPLVLCGHMPVDRVRALQGAAVNAGLAPAELLLTGYVTDEELAALYRCCGAFVFPSIYEGSGLPMLEAMAFGIPVVAADASTSEEILGDRLLAFDPHDPAAMARSIARGLIDDPMRARLKRRSRERVGRFTWAHVATRSIVAYDAAGGRTPAQPSTA